MNALPDGLAEWWETRVRSSFAWLNLIGQDGTVPQLCQAWVVFDGTAGVGAITPADSYNITSVTKNATGDYTVVMTIPFATANYALAVSTNNSGGAVIAFVDTATTKTTTTFRIQTRNAAGTMLDSTAVSAMAFGRR